MDSHQLKIEPGHRGVSEVVGYGESMGTKVQHTDHSVTSTTVGQAEVVAMGGVK